LYLGAFLENYWKCVVYFIRSILPLYSPPRFGLLKKTATGFDVAVSSFSATDRQAFTWVERDVAGATLALLKNYTDPSKNISGKSYPIVNANIPYAELAALTGEGAPTPISHCWLIDTEYSISSPWRGGDLHHRAAHGDGADGRDGES
jgi:hypothetical protein